MYKYATDTIEGENKFAIEDKGNGLYQVTPLCRNNISDITIYWDDDTFTDESKKLTTTKIE